jgi:hypothetical protein
MKLLSHWLKIKNRVSVSARKKFMNNFCLTHRDRQGDRAIEANTDKNNSCFHSVKENA